MKTFNKEDLLKQGFTIKDHPSIKGGFLVFPSKANTFTINWNKDNLIFRSSLWVEVSQGLYVLASASFPKFFNWGERPDLCEPPESLANTVAVEKIDGSTLIVSKWCGELIIRTRGTTDARDLENGEEIDQLIAKYPVAFDNQLINSEAHTLLFEWVTPTNRIVLDYGTEPLLYLTGIVKHDGYKLASQDKLDGIAVMMNVERAKTYDFNSVSEMTEAVKAFKGKEGVCVYFGKDHQQILKLKGTEYLAKHAFLSHCTMKSVLEMFVERDCPTYQEYINQLAADFDWECVQMAQGLVSKVCNAKQELDKMLAHVEKFVEPLRTIDRKEAARRIQEAYGSTEKTKCAFLHLDKNPIEKRMIKKLLEQICRRLYT